MLETQPLAGNLVRRSRPRTRTGFGDLRTRARWQPAAEITHFPESSSCHLGRYSLHLKEQTASKESVSTPHPLCFPSTHTPTHTAPATQSQNDLLESLWSVSEILVLPVHTAPRARSTGARAGWEAVDGWTDGWTDG